MPSVKPTFYTDRKTLRAQLLAARLGMTPQDRAQADALITQRLGMLLDDIEGTLGFYWPMQGEFDTRPLVVQWLAAKPQRRAALPVVALARAPLVFCPWQPGAAMTTGIFNTTIPQDPRTLTPDTLLIPLVGFDTAGYRLGYGGGYYDRTLAQMPTVRTIGVGYALGRLDHFEPEPHDIALHTIVSD
jgi:5-formyltetrahydrofolate cyclo-ligase